jgi:disulfide reductase
MKSKIVLLAVSGLLLQAAQAQTWMTEFPQALAQAQQQDRAVFLFFTGSDWCPWCKALDKEVLSTREFTDFAKDNLVLVKVDFPRHHTLAPVQAQANARLAQRFGIQAYPTVCILNKEGNQVAEMGYMEGGPMPFLKQLRGVSGFNWKGSAGKSGTEPAKPAAAAPPPPPYNGAQTFPAKRYEQLTLTGIAGSKKRPMVIINNQTLEQGETAPVRLRDREVMVLCKEIRAKSAIILIDGTREPMELFLGGEK